VLNCGLDGAGHGLAHEMLGPLITRLRGCRLFIGPRAAACSLSPPYPLADKASLSGKLASASLLGEGGFEAFNRALPHPI
jgi:hypothetical protein